jgi:tetratricopeptide (TPR) repeat protein
LTAEGIPKITDFGLAKLMDSESGQTPSEAFLGTPSYMAPEQAAGRARDVGAPSDVYALGAILYELLTGRPPFRAATPLDTMMLVISREPVAPTRLQPRVPRDLETICLKCLEKDPQRRHPDAGALADELARFLAGEPIRSRPINGLQRGIKWARRRRPIALMAGVSIAAVLTLLTFALWFEVSGRRRLSELRAEGGRSVERARVALSGGDLQGAKVHLARALAGLGREPALADESSQAARLLGEVDRKLDARARLARFNHWRDEVLFRATQSLDSDSDAIRQAASSAARQAFVTVNLRLEGESRPVFDPAFDRGERDAIALGSYELLLVLADALAHPLTHQAPEDHRARVAEALRLLDRAAALRPPTRAYHLRRARCLAILGDEAAARQERAWAATLQPAGALDAFLAGVDLFMGGEGSAGRKGLEEAIRNFDQAYRLQPDHFWAQYYLAVCALTTGHPDLAKAYLNSCLKQRPDFVWIPLLRGFAQGQLRDFDAAEADFRRVCDLGPDEDARYALFVNRGAIRLVQGRLDEASADLERAIAMKPDRYRAYVNLAQLCEKQGRRGEAAERLDQAIRLGPPDLVLADLQADRAHLLLLTGRLREAVRASDALLAAHPDATDALGVRGQALLELGEFAASARSFTQYLERGGAPMADIYRGRGQARMKLGEYPGAVDDYTRALELKSDREIRMHRGWAYFFTESPKLALRDFEESLRLDPSGIEALIGRGLARVALGQDREAIADAEEALRRPPASPEMILNIACIFARAAGRQDPAGHYRRQAVEALRQALDKLPVDERPPFWRDKVLTDSYLDPLRRSPEFLQLGRQLEGDPRRPAP